MNSLKQLYYYVSPLNQIIMIYIRTYVHVVHINMYIAVYLMSQS